MPAATFEAPTCGYICPQPVSEVKSEGGALSPVAAEPPAYQEKWVGTPCGYIPVSYPAFCETTQSIDKDVQVVEAPDDCVVALEALACDDLFVAGSFAVTVSPV